MGLELIFQYFTRVFTSMVLMKMGMQYSVLFCFYLAFVSKQYGIQRRVLKCFFFLQLFWKILSSTTTVSSLNFWQNSSKNLSDLDFVLMTNFLAILLLFTDFKKSYRFKDFFNQYTCSCVVDMHICATLVSPLPRKARRGHRSWNYRELIATMQVLDLKIRSFRRTASKLNQ